MGKDWRQLFFENFKCIVLRLIGNIKECLPISYAFISSFKNLFFPIRECNSERPQAEFPLQHRKCFHSADDWRIDEMQTTVLRDKSDGRVTCFRKLHIKECGLGHRNPKRFVALEVSITEFQLQAFKKRTCKLCT